MILRTYETTHFKPHLCLVMYHTQHLLTFTLQDRGDPDVIDRSFNEVQFDARLADEVPEFANLDAVPGVDGFAISVDPLYKVISIFHVKSPLD